jgi:hypothetical protein
MNKNKKLHKKTFQKNLTQEELKGKNKRNKHPNIKWDNTIYPPQGPDFKLIKRELTPEQNSKKPHCYWCAKINIASPAEMCFDNNLGKKFFGCKKHLTVTIEDCLDGYDFIYVN